MDEKNLSKSVEEIFCKFVWTRYVQSFITQADAGKQI